MKATTTTKNKRSDGNKWQHKSNIKRNIQVWNINLFFSFSVSSGWNVRFGKFTLVLLRIYNWQVHCLKFAFFFVLSSPRCDIRVILCVCVCSYLFSSIFSIFFIYQIYNTLYGKQFIFFSDLIILSVHFCPLVFKLVHFRHEYLVCI